MTEESPKKDRERFEDEKKGYQPVEQGYQPDKDIEAGYQPDDPSIPEDGNLPTIEDTIDPSREE